MSVFLGSLCASGTLVVMRGFVFQQLWAWFVVPQFGLATLSLGIACGLVTLVGFVANFPTSVPDEETRTGEDVTKAFVFGVTLTALVLLYGFVIHEVIA